MQNAKRIMMCIGSVLCLLSASLSTAKSVEQVKNVAPVIVSQHHHNKVAARFNFEHVRFEFIRLVNGNTLQKSNKRKRIAFSNLV